MIHTTRKQLNIALKELGYKIEDHSSFTYYNEHTQRKEHSCYIVEVDTGISFAHYKNARRDDNFNRLQDFRMNEFMIRGVVYSI